MGVAVDQKELCIKFCENIKQVQVVRFKEVGFTEDEANDLWSRYCGDYLMAWREYVANGLVSLPKGLTKVLPDVVNEVIGRE